MHAPHIESWAEQAITLFELINPSNIDRADDQHAAFLELLEQKAEDEISSSVELMWLVKEATEGESSFCVSWRGAPEFIGALTAILPDEDTEIDWGTDDPNDEDFLQSTTVPELLRQAYASLLDLGYTLWCWDTEGDTYVGWLTQSIDEGELMDVAERLGINVRTAEEPF